MKTSDVVRKTLVRKTAGRKIVVRKAVDSTSAVRTSEVKPWFKAQRYGSGFYPSSKEGWFVYALHIALVITWADIFIRERQGDTWGILWFGTAVLVQSALFFWICYLKGERIIDKTVIVERNTVRKKTATILVNGNKR